MEPEETDKPLDLEAYGQRPRRRVEAADIVAAVFSVVWVGLVAGFWYFVGFTPSENGPGFNPVMFVMTMVSILLPIGLIWVASAGIKTSRVMREEAQRLQASIDAMRHAYVMQQQAAGNTLRPEIEQRLTEIAQSQKQTETAIARISSSAEAADDAPSTTKPALSRESGEQDTTQPLLALEETGASQPQDPITIAEFIRAMNFPDNENDIEGFRTLRRALKERDMARMIRASQDVLTLLSQDGIYMDDLRPDKPRAETWRRFARGERGPAVAGLGGIHDRSCLALASGRMRKDPIFRDAVMHFLRQFDLVLSDFEKNATDRELIEMGETRTARAFMLLGKVAGTFD
ncbi:MAG: hypothetical protein Q9M41_07910 [Paracoccaceae bacterium]|nr:hypothetical protein [Paracoccaceae bacterium]